MRLSSSQVVCSVNGVVKTVRVIEQSANNRRNLNIVGENSEKMCLIVKQRNIQSIGTKKYIACFF